MTRFTQADLRTSPRPHITVIVEVDARGKRSARCNCSRQSPSCRHIWIAALVQAALNRLCRHDMPSFRLDFYGNGVIEQAYCSPVADGGLCA